MRAVCRKVMQHFENIGIPGHDPGMEEWIPVNGIFGAQALIEWIRIRQNVRIEQMIKAESASSRSSANCAIAGTAHALLCSVFKAIRNSNLSPYVSWTRGALRSRAIFS